MPLESQRCDKRCPGQESRPGVPLACQLPAGHRLPHQAVDDLGVKITWAARVKISGRNLGKKHTARARESIRRMTLRAMRSDESRARTARTLDSFAADQARTLSRLLAVIFFLVRLAQTIEPPVFM